MEKVEVEDIENEPNPMGVNTVRKPISDALDADEAAIVHYELDPGESFSGGLHTHHDQEETFYVLDGTATFDVGEEREEVTVEAGEAVRFDPGEFQHGYNDSDERIVGLAIAAPGARHDWDQLESLVPCSECGEETVHSVSLTDEGVMAARCTECGNELQLS